MLEEKIKDIIKRLDKFKLINVISSIYYYYRVIGEYNMMSTIELEYIMGLIYQIKNVEQKEPSKGDILTILSLTNSILGINPEEYAKAMESQNDKFLFTHVKDSFFYVKEDTEYDSMVFEYLNLFNPVEYFFKTYYSFKIEDFLYLTKFIQIEYHNRMSLIKETLNKMYEEVTIEILVQYLLELNDNILGFNEETLTKDKERKFALKNILYKFSTSEKECVEKDFETYPILKKGNTYVLTSIVTLLYKAKNIFEKEIRKDKILANVYAYKKGEFLEILTQNVVKDILKDGKIFPNIKYRENKMDRECDLLVIYDQVILIIEIKSRAFKEISKEGAEKYLKEDLNDNIYKAYNQATRMEKYLRKNSNVKLRFGYGKEVLKIQNTDKFKIFKVGITLENFREYAVQYNEFNKNINYDMVFFNINDLKFMSKYFRYQTEFIHYISQRIKTNQYIRKFYMYDELYLFSEYKMFNLQRILNNDHRVKVYDIGRYKLFDLRFDIERKEQILRGDMMIHPFFDKIIKEMETEKLPTYSFTIMSLLDIDIECQKDIFNQLKATRFGFIRKKSPTYQCISLAEERDTKGMYMLMAVTDRANQKTALEGVIILGSIIKNKYSNCDVLGILNNIENDENNITSCLKIMDPKPDFKKYLDMVQELKDWQNMI